MQKEVDSFIASLIVRRSNTSVKICHSSSMVKNLKSGKNFFKLTLGRIGGTENQKRFTIDAHYRAKSIFLD